MTRLCRRAQRATHDRMKPGIDPSSPEVVRACTGKVNSFISKKRALAAAAEASKRIRIHLFVYRCRFCRGRFHYTSKKPSDHTFVVVPIPGEHNGRMGRLWFTEDDSMMIEHFVDRIFHLIGLDTREICVDLELSAGLE